MSDVLREQASPDVANAHGLGLAPQVQEWIGRYYRAKGWRREAAGQRQKLLELRATCWAIQGDGFKPGALGSADDLRKQKLQPGREFRSYLDSLAGFEKAKQDERSLLVGGLRQAAQAYLNNYAGHTERQQQQEQTKAKKHACEKTLSDLRRFETAGLLENELSKLGSPPWDSEKTARLNELKATIDFETLPNS